jgi:glycosyltransferase involved in cell wall biosynthesis
VKIGFFIPNATFDFPGSPEVGGIETYSFTVGEALQRLGHEVVLFGGRPKAGRGHRATTIPLELSPYWETKSIPDIGTRFQRLVQRLHFAWTSRHAWRRHQCDVVILAKPFDWPVAWFWKRSRPGLKVIMGFHGTDFFAGDRYFYHAVDAAFAVSPRVAQLAKAHVGVRPVSIPNPVDLDIFHPAADAPPRSAAAPWHLVASGRFIGWKGFAVLLDALALARDRHQLDFHLSLAGSGTEQDRLEAQIGRLDLGGRVELCGRLAPEGLRDLMRSGDLYVVPSIGLDACPISALEALAVGLPLLLSDQVGLNDFLTDRDIASYPSRSVDALVDRLVALHARRHEADWNDHQARHERVRDLVSAEKVAQRILDLAA